MGQTVFMAQMVQLQESQDNSVGIPIGGRLENIFQHYVSTKEEPSGTGLGLRIFRMLTSLHLLGSLTAKNEDRWMCFRLFLLQLTSFSSASVQAKSLINQNLVGMLPKES